MVNRTLLQCLILHYSQSKIASPELKALIRPYGLLAIDSPSWYRTLGSMVAQGVLKKTERDRVTSYQLTAEGRKELKAVHTIAVELSNEKTT